MRVADQTRGGLRRLGWGEAKAALKKGTSAAKGSLKARVQSLGPSFCLYSPDVVEEEFSEVDLQDLG